MKDKYITDDSDFLDTDAQGFIDAQGFEDTIRSLTLVPSLIVDIEGTVGYREAHSPIMKLYSDVESILWDYKDRGFLIFGCVNCSDVAHGKLKIERHLEYLEKLLDQFEYNPFYRVRVCYFDETGTTAPFNVRSLMRKPDVGMLVGLENDAINLGYMINWKESIVIGDLEEDRLLAERANIMFKWAWEFFNRPAVH